MAMSGEREGRESQTKGQGPLQGESEACDSVVLNGIEWGLIFKDVGGAELAKKKVENPPRASSGWGCEHSGRMGFGQAT